MRRSLRDAVPASLVTDRVHHLSQLQTFERPEAARVIQPRRVAIREAWATAAPGDVVLVAGKGHERGQTIGNQVTDFDDAEVLAEIIAEADA